MNEYILKITRFEDRPSRRFEIRNKATGRRIVRTNSLPLKQFHDHLDHALDLILQRGAVEVVEEVKRWG